MPSPSWWKCFLSSGLFRNKALLHENWSSWIRYGAFRWIQQGGEPRSKSEENDGSHTTNKTDDIPTQSHFNRSYLQNFGDNFDRRSTAITWTSSHKAILCSMMLCYYGWIFKIERRFHWVKLKIAPNVRIRIKIWQWIIRSEPRGEAWKSGNRSSVQDDGEKKDDPGYESEGHESLD